MVRQLRRKKEKETSINSQTKKFVLTQLVKEEVNKLWSDFSWRNSEICNLFGGESIQFIFSVWGLT